MASNFNHVWTCFMPEGVTHTESRPDHLECHHKAKMGQFSDQNTSVCVCEGKVLPDQLIFFCDEKEKAMVVVYLGFSKRCNYFSWNYPE